MTLVDIPDGATVFVDANILVYHFVPHPTLGPSCKQLVERIGRQEITAVTSTHAYSDAVHRVMTMEAISQLGWPPAGIAPRIKRHHAEIAKLVQFRLAAGEIPRLGLRVLPVFSDHVGAAAGLSQQHELLSGDALIVALMQDRGLTHLASHDTDFDRVPGIMRYAPG